MKRTSKSEEDDKYWKGFSKGCRLGHIESARDIVVRALKHYGKPSRDLLHKVYMETDISKLYKILCDLLREQISVAKVEESFDLIYRTKKEARAGEYGWHWYEVSTNSDVTASGDCE